MVQTRQLICTFMGHVDSGKSSIQDKIRESSIVKGEAGGITQAIGASIIPLRTIKQKCGPLLQAAKLNIDIPGLLFIDTPGHAAFTNLRKRGGSLADIAILVIDIEDGIMPQTLEAISILRSNKTPFVVVANKIDRISGWQSNKDKFLIKNISLQAEGTRKSLDIKIYQLIGKLSELGFQSERFDRVQDHTKELSVVPLSALTGEGIPELLMVLIGLAQKYMMQKLESHVENTGKGVILEVKETVGLGKTIDVILHDGHLKKGDKIIIGGLNEPIITKVKALLQPEEHAEMMDKKSKYKQVNEVNAATGVKISANDLDNVVAGMPLISYIEDNELEKIKEQVQELVEEVIIETEEEGVILKADNIGSLEALINLFKEKNIPIRKATIGDVSRKDVMEAIANKEQDEFLGVIIGFNVRISHEVGNYAKEHEIEIIDGNVIYHLIEEYTLWKDRKTKEMQSKELDKLTRPFKIEILDGYVFRQNNPAVCGVDVVNGVLKSGVKIMKENGDVIDTIKNIQKEKDSVQSASKGEQVAISLPKTTIGRQIKEGDVLYSVIPEADFKSLKELKKLLSNEEKELLKQIAEIMRKGNSMWGV